MILGLGEMGIRRKRWIHPIQLRIPDTRVIFADSAAGRHFESFRGFTAESSFEMGNRNY